MKLADYINQVFARNKRARETVPLQSSLTIKLPLEVRRSRILVAVYASLGELGDPETTYDGLITAVGDKVRLVTRSIGPEYLNIDKGIQIYFRHTDAQIIQSIVDQIAIHAPMRFFAGQIVGDVFLYGYDT